LRLGSSRYDVDVIGFIKPLLAAVGPPSEGKHATPGSRSGQAAGRPATVVEVVGFHRSLRHGRLVTLRLDGPKQLWEHYWRQLVLAHRSPEKAGGGKISLAFGPLQSDESSCATSAQKEASMTNTDKPDTVPPVTTTGRAKPTRSPRGTAPKKSSAKRRKGPTSASPTDRRASGRPQKGTKPKPAVAAQGKKARTQSKGAQILDLIGRPQGATLPEIMRGTAWQAHSVRGFLSTAAKKHNLKIDSARNEAGERVYKTQR
jgi:hypothetical protein